MTLIYWPHYKTIGHSHNDEQPRWEVANLREITIDEMNWLVLSTSGVHGSYTTLDELDLPDDITFLVIQPRLVVLHYGNVTVRNEEDRTWLREAVNKTLAAIKDSQEGNL